MKADEIAKNLLENKTCENCGWYTYYTLRLHLTETKSHGVKISRCEQRKYNTDIPSENTCELWSNGKMRTEKARLIYFPNDS